MAGKLRKRDWISLIEKIERELDGGKGILLSLGGGRTLLNSSLSVSPLYFLSYYELPRWLEKRIDI